MANVAVMSDEALSDSTWDRLVARGHSVVTLSSLGRDPAREVVDGTWPEVLRDCDVLILHPDLTCDVEDLVTGSGNLAAALRPGTALIDATRSSPASAARIAAALEPRGIHMVDAAFLESASADPGLAIAVGGTERAAALCEGVLHDLGAGVYHLGQIGAGHVALALTALLHSSAATATAEVLEAARRSGIVTATAVDVLNNSSGRSYVTEFELSGTVDADDGDAVDRIGRYETEVRVAIDMARGDGMVTPMADRVASILGLIAFGGRARADGVALTDYVTTLSPRSTGPDA